MSFKDRVISAGRYSVTGDKVSILSLPLPVSEQMIRLTVQEVRHGCNRIFVLIRHAE